MSSSARWAWAAALAGALVLLWLLGPILMPFVLGAGLAYLGDPLVDRLERLRLSRSAAVTLVFIAIFATLLGAAILLLPLLQQQIVTLVRNIPEWIAWLQGRFLPALGISIPPLDTTTLRNLLVENWEKAGGLAAAVLGPATQSGMAILTFAANLLLTPVVTFYLLRDWDRLTGWIADMIPRPALPKVSLLASETDTVLGAFIRGQLLVMAVLAAVYITGLWLAGLHLAVLIGLVAGLVSFVPYLGFIVGFGSAAIAILVQTHDLWSLAPIGLVFLIGQVLESMVLTPLLVGDRIGLHPVAVIFAVMAGGQLFGLTGVLLGLPAAAVLAVLARHAKDLWLGSNWYGATASNGPIPLEDRDPRAPPGGGSG